VRRLCLASFLAAVLAVVAVSGVAAAANPRSSTPQRARHVVLVSVPTLTWSDLADAPPPAIRKLLASSAVASLSVRTIGPRTTIAEGYVSLGAGNRATVRPESASSAFGPDDPFEGTTAASAFTRRTGQRARGAVLQLEIVDITRSAARMSYGAEPGALGEALERAHRSAAVVANGDSPVLRAGVEPHREAALAVMDADGRVDGGTVDTALTTTDPAWPFGVRADEEAVNTAFDQAMASNDVVLVEASDAARLDRYRSFMTPTAQERADASVLDAADRLVAHVLDTVDLSRDVVVLLAPVGPSARERLTTFAIAGPGFEPGLARSASTRRAGYVTLPDIAPTVLHALGIPAPESMAGTLISSAGGGPPQQGDLEAMARADEIAGFRDRAVGPVSVAFIVFQVLVYAAALIAVTGHRHWLRPYVAVAALAVLAMPSVVFLSGLVHYDRLGIVGYTVAVFAASLALAGGVWLVARRRLFLAPSLLIGATLAVLLVDVVTGARLQINTAFGYSPIVAGRFAGYGNLAFALVAMAAIVIATTIWAAPRLHRPDGPRVGPPLVAAVGLFLVVLALDGLPSFGSDVGGVLATLPAFAVTTMLLAGIGIGWRRVVGIGVVTLGAVAAFAAVDLSRPEDQRTHLGRFAQRLLDGDVGDILTRKAEANISLLTSSVWTYVIPVALAFLGFLTWRPSGFLRELQREVPGLRPCLIGALVAGVLGFALNDSGVAVPAMMFGVLLPYITWLLMRTAVAGAPNRPT
jgi:hypothetical protein